MGLRLEMYRVLERMIESARSADGTRLRELNKLFESLVPQVYSDSTVSLDLNYDNCRQSCVMSVMMPWIREKFLADVDFRFERIPQPRE
jgi:hypothetical protein